MSHVLTISEKKGDEKVVKMKEMRMNVVHLPRYDYLVYSEFAILTSILNK